MLFDYWSEIFIGCLLSLIVYLLWANKDSEKRKFDWHKLITNEFHLSFLGSANEKCYSVDIVINTDKRKIEVTKINEKRCQIEIPARTKNSDLKKWVENFEYENKVIEKLIKGIYFEENILSLKLPRVDFLNYREFTIFFTKSMKGT